MVAYSDSEWQKLCLGEGVPAVSICDMGVLGGVCYTNSHLKNFEILFKLTLSIDYRKQFHRSQKLSSRFHVL